MIIIEYLIGYAALIVSHPIISVVSLFIVLTLLYLIFKKRFAKISLTLSSIVNVLFLPLSLFIGGMATDDPNSTFFDFWVGFFYFQGVPLFWFVLSFFIYKRFWNKSKSPI